uniref:Uncharacterized protein n=1 Tax=Oryza nivara TaxID=4536 RepID=A0A0E0GLM2_ORYNI
MDVPESMIVPPVPFVSANADSGTGSLVDPTVMPFSERCGLDGAAAILVEIGQQWEKLPTLSCDGRDSGPRPNPAMPVSLDLKTPLLKRPQPNATPGTDAPAPNVNLSTSSKPVVTDLSLPWQSVESQEVSKSVEDVDRSK